MLYKRIVIIISILFLLLVCLSTAYSLQTYRSQLPVVEVKYIASDAICPSEAIYEDPNGGYYLLVVNEQEGPWGKEYILKQVFVNIASKGSFVVLLGPPPVEPVVLSSNLPIDADSIVNVSYLDN